MNLQRDPRNYDVVLSNKYNLLKLAKKNEFKTVFISSQADVAAYMPRKYIDEYLVRDQHDIAPLFDKMHDDALIKILSNLELKNRNMVILHQRNAHAPYHRNYRHRVDEFEKYKVAEEDRHKRKTLNTYDNATLYNDSFISDAIAYIRENMEGSVYMFYTSDHGENLGEDGLWGHGMLAPATADIPFLAYVKNADEEYINRLKSMPIPTHFDIGVLIAELLGYKVSDPNTPDGTYYINGKGIAGELDYIKYQKGAEDKIVYAENN
jgi:glucan phosphoethanolaminetransferase (alkaline phosphatase superfamily)